VLFFFVRLFGPWPLLKGIVCSDWKLFALFCCSCFFLLLMVCSLQAAVLPQANQHNSRSLQSINLDSCPILNPHQFGPFVWPLKKMDGTFSAFVHYLQTCGIFSVLSAFMNFIDN
jgi:hypothetical protein